MKRNFTLLMLALWLGMGAIWYSDYKNSVAHPDPASVRLEMENLAKQAKTQGKFMDSLPVIFNKYPAVGAIFLFNEKKQLIGSLYESERFTRAHYRYLLEKKQEMLEKKSRKSTVIQIGEKSSAVIFYNHDITFSAIIKDLIKRNSQLKWMVSFYFFVIFVMALLLVVFSGRKFEDEETPARKTKLVLSIGQSEEEKRKKQTMERRPETPMQEPVEFSAKSNELQKEKPRFIETRTIEEPGDTDRDSQDSGDPGLIGSEPFFSQKVLSLMESLEQKYSAVSVRYYFWDGAAYQPVVQKQGGILVKGEAVPKAPESFKYFVENHDIRITDHGMAMVIPLVYRNALIGLLALDSRTGLNIDEKEKREIMGACSSFAQSIFLHRIYDAATVDADTDFYTYPYFYFYLQEKLRQSHSFLSFVFELPELNTISPKTLRVWAKNVLFKMEEENLKPDICVRMDRSKFVFVFDSAIYSRGGQSLSSIERAPGLIENYTQTAFKNRKPLAGGFFIRPKQIDSVDTYLKRLEYVLVESRLNPGGISTLLDPDAANSIERRGNVLRIR